MTPHVFDIEGASITERYTCDPAAYVRIVGALSGGRYRDTIDIRKAARDVAAARLSAGHNSLSFDLQALARAVPGVIDVLALTRQRRHWDTMVGEAVLDPPEPPPGAEKDAQAVAHALKHYALDAVAKRHGVTGKVDDLPALAEKHGGYDRIPLDDPEYRRYLAGDVAATARILADQSDAMTDYAWREMRVAAIAGEMSAAGVLLDEPLTRERAREEDERKAERARWLADRHGLPLTSEKGKPFASPQASKPGKESLVKAFTSLGVPDAALPRTGKGAYSFGGDAMRALGEKYGGEVAAVADAVATMAGARVVYGTALKHRQPSDGCVHPQILMFQASGRWSTTKPGLTVFGKRGGRVRERRIFRARPGHILAAFDLSQIDSRAIAVHSQDHAYLDLFSPGLDAHEIVARMVWGDAAYDADPKGLRTKVKQITHGVPYGMGVPKLALSAGVPEATAQLVVDTMNYRFPRLQEWKREVRTLGEYSGVLDNGFGRRMLVQRGRSFTQSVALMGQGTARDLMMECMLRLPDDIARMLRIQVHDEIIVEIPKRNAIEVMHVIKRCMDFEWAPPGASRPVRIEADCSGFGETWEDCYL